MSLFNSLTFTVHPTAPGSYVKGDWVAGTPEDEFNIKGSFQPITGKDLETLPEGRRNSENFYIYTSSNMKIAQQGTNQDSWELTNLADNSRYEIFNKESWQNNIISHFRYSVTRITAVEERV